MTPSCYPYPRLLMGYTSYSCILSLSDSMMVTPSKAEVFKSQGIFKCYGDLLGVIKALYSEWLSLLV